jgi:hypothetical protein
MIYFHKVSKLFQGRPFFPGTEGLVTPAGLAPAFSGPGVAAHNIPELKNDTEMMRPMRAVFINFDFIMLPKFIYLFRPLKSEREVYVLKI